MLNLTYPYWSSKSLLRSIYSPGRGASDPYNRACHCSSALYYDSRGYSGHGPRYVSYSRKTSRRGTRNSLATSGKNYSGSPLHDGVRDVRSAPYRRNGLSYRKMTYKGAC